MVVMASKGLRAAEHTHYARTCMMSSRQLPYGLILAAVFNRSLMVTLNGVWKSKGKRTRKRRGRSTTRLPIVGNTWRRRLRLSSMGSLPNCNRAGRRQPNPPGILEERQQRMQKVRVLV